MPHVPRLTPGSALDVHHDAAEADARELADLVADHGSLDAEAALWAARQQDGLSPQEEAELEAWLAGHPERGQRLAQLQGLWGRLDEVPPDDVAQLKTLVMPEDRNMTAPTRRGKSPGWRWVLGWAGWARWAPPAALAGVLAMTAGGGWMGWQHWQAQPLSTQTYQVARGQQMHLSLPDGSALHLDTDTQATVTLYRQRREVQLWRGQALFTVQPEAQRPFQVLAGPVRVTVVGTRFMVRHHDAISAAKAPDAPRVSVVVEEGHVRVTPFDGVNAHGPSPSAVVDLYAGDAVMASAQGRIRPMSPAAVAGAMAWRDGRIVLNDTPLWQAVAEFERYTDTGLHISEPAVGALRLNGSFDVRQAQAFKQALPQALPVRLRERADGATDVISDLRSD